MNNDRILKKVKMKVAISNMKEEDMAMKKNKYIIAKGMGIAACIALSMTGVVFAKSQIVSKFGKNSSGGIHTAVNNGYYCDVQTKYMESNGISASIESFLIDDRNFDMTINMKFNENYNLQEMLSNNGNIDLVDLQVVNENGQIVFATAEMDCGSTVRNSIDERNNKYLGAYGSNVEKIGENEIKLYLNATGNGDKFPSSKKLIVTFSKVRNRHISYNEYKDFIYEGDWKYELDVPDNMSKSNIVRYELVSISDENYQFESADVSNTAFRIYLNNCEGIQWNGEECVETSNGNKYYPAMRSDGDGCISIKDGTTSYYQTFNLTNYDATESLKVHVFKSSGEEVVICLQKVN